jgi:hypothetical protein
MRVLGGERIEGEKGLTEAVFWGRVIALHLACSRAVAVRAESVRVFAMMAGSRCLG